MRHKKKLSRLILVSSIIGAIIMSVPLPTLTGYLDTKYCPYKLLKEQTDADGIPLCEKLTTQRLKEVHQAFCKDGKLYSLREKENCISKVVFYPTFSLLESFFSDIEDVGIGGAVFIIIFFAAHGAFIGAFIGFIIPFLIKIFQK